MTTTLAAVSAVSTEAVTSVTLAGPLDEVNTWLGQWGSSFQILGATILGICAIFVGIKLGAKSVASSGPSSGTRESLGALFQLAIAGIIIGAALLLVPMLINIGKGSGTPAPAAPAATSGETAGA
ncbi:MAG TPA: hypothetical protein VIU11_18870 [Nakamurella sp.]